MRNPFSKKQIEKMRDYAREHHGMSAEESGKAITESILLTDKINAEMRNALTKIIIHNTFGSTNNPEFIINILSEDCLFYGMLNVNMFQGEERLDDLIRRIKKIIKDNEND